MQQQHHHHQIAARFVLCIFVDIVANKTLSKWQLPTDSIRRRKIHVICESEYKHTILTLIRIWLLPSFRFFFSSNISPNKSVCQTVLFGIWSMHTCVFTEWMKMIFCKSKRKKHALTIIHIGRSKINKQNNEIQTNFSNLLCFKTGSGWVNKLIRVREQLKCTIYTAQCTSTSYSTSN